MAVAVGAAIVVSLIQTPQYHASAQVQVPTATASGVINGDRSSDPQREIRNQVDFVHSDAVTATAHRALGTKTDISIGSSDNRDTLTFTSTSTSAHRAATVANTWAATYLTVRRQTDVDSYTHSRGTVRRRIQQVESDQGALQQSVTILQNRAAAATDPAQQASLSAQATARQAQIQPQLDSLNAEHVDLQSSLQDLQLAGDLLDQGGPTLISKAEVPTAPFEPSLPRNAAIALGLGLLLGVALAFVREQLDDTVTTRADLEVATGGLPVLGQIPRPGDRRDPVPLPTVTASGSPAAEAYRSLRTSVRFLGVERAMTTLLVTSPGTGDGKTITVANLAVAMSRAGQRCVVVCADLRRPRLPDLFDVAPSPGLTTVILGEIGVDEALQEVPGQEGLSVLATGELPPNPSELLSTDAAAKALRSLASSFEVVLVDAPPVLPVTDALVLAQQVDGVMLVADARRTGLADIREAWQRLAQVDAPLVGTVLNDAQASARAAYTYGG